MKLLPFTTVRAVGKAWIQGLTAVIAVSNTSKAFFVGQVLFPYTDTLTPFNSFSNLCIQLKSFTTAGCNHKIPSLPFYYWYEKQAEGIVFHIDLVASISPTAVTYLRTTFIFKLFLSWIDSCNKYHSLQPFCYQLYDYYTLLFLDGKRTKQNNVPGVSTRDE